MNSARARGQHRIRQATAVLAGVGVLATGAVAGLAHASDRTTASTSLTTTSAASSTGSASSVQLGVAGAAPQAQTGGS
jgi:hypothetical protein